MKNLRALRLCVLFVCSLCVFFIASCSKQEGSSAVVSTKDSIVSKLPEGAFGFVYANLASEPYKRYVNHPGYKKYYSSYMTLAESDPSLAAFKPYFNTLTQLGLLPTENAPSRLQESVFFGTIAAGNMVPEIGLYGSAIKSGETAKIIAEIESTLKKENFELTPETYANGKGFSMTVFAAGAPGGADMANAMNPVAIWANMIGPKKLYFAGNDAFIGISTSKTSAELILSDAAKTPSTLTTTKEFSTAMNGLGSRADELGYGYIDLKRVLNTVKPSLPDKSIEEVLNSLPVESGALSVRMKTGLITTASVGINPKTEEQKNWFNAVGSSSTHGSLNKISGNPFFVLSLDGGVLSRVKDLVLKMPDIPTPELLAQELKVLDQIQSISLGVQGAAGPSPFPEVMLTLNSKDAAGLAKTLKDKLGMAVDVAAGGMLGEWQTKDIAGAKVEFLMSPLGVGLYFTNAGDAVYLASSETSVSGLLSAGQDSSKTFVASRTGATKEFLKDAKGGVIMYLSYSDLFKMLESTQGTLSMFTGQPGGMDMKQFEHLKNLGSMTSSIGYDKGYLKLEASQDLPS